MFSPFRLIFSHPHLTYRLLLLFCSDSPHVFDYHYDPHTSLPFSHLISLSFSLYLSIIGHVIVYVCHFFTLLSILLSVRSTTSLRRPLPTHVSPLSLIQTLHLLSRPIFQRPNLFQDRFMASMLVWYIFVQHMHSISLFLSLRSLFHLPPFSFCDCASGGHASVPFHAHSLLCHSFVCSFHLVPLPPFFLSLFIGSLFFSFLFPSFLIFKSFRPVLSLRLAVLQKFLSSNFHFHCILRYLPSFRTPHPFSHGLVVASSPSLYISLSSFIIIIIHPLFLSFSSSSPGLARYTYISSTVLVYLR